MTKKKQLNKLNKGMVFLDTKTKPEHIIVGMDKSGLVYTSFRQNVSLAIERTETTVGDERNA